MLSNHRSFTRFAVALLLLVFSMSPIFASPSAETAADSADGSGQTAAVPRRIAGAGRGLIQSIGVPGHVPRRHGRNGGGGRYRPGNGRLL
jgi:hypothetical protein